MIVLADQLTFVFHGLDELHGHQRVDIDVGEGKSKITTLMRRWKANIGKAFKTVELVGGTGVIELGEKSIKDRAWWRFHLCRINKRR
jgi:hypothetical protein